MKHNSQGQMDLSKYLDPRLDDKILALPLQFEYLPVQIISKQYTKLNSNHPFRIHYLGPRFTNTLNLHKKYSIASNTKDKNYFQEMLGYEKYQVQMRKILQSNFLNEKMQNNHYYKSSIFYRAFEGMNPTLDLKDEVIFNSCFEAGNLDCVVKVTPMEYDLFLRIDSNTRGHTLWFYFSVQNGNKLGKITFNICNLTKPKALYQQGLKPYVFSKKKYQKCGQNWQQDGENLLIQQKKLRYNIVYEMLDSLKVFKLSFQYNFTQQNDEVFFAYSIPYTYSQLLRDIQRMPTQLVKKNILGRSLTGVDIPVLHITNHQNHQKEKKNVLILGRAHPGQSNGSHLLKGFMDFLCSESQKAVQLRNRVNFIIVPMTNPDGVILGNSRSSASGKDLNRQYLTTKKQLYPQVFAIKNLAYKLQKNENVFMFFDFHGHSQKKNTFFYGPPYAVSQSQYYKSRALAKLIQKINNNFRYHSCSFYISEEKKRTARAVLFEQYKIPYVFTVQSSIGLYYDSNKLKTQQFTIQQWAKMGADVCLGVNQFIKAIQQYQQIIKQRRKERQRKKLHRKTMKQRKFIEDGGNQDHDNSINAIENKKGGIMFEMIEQIKQMPPPKNPDLEASSDDHDDGQDLEDGKLKQFNNLIIQSKQKNQINIHNKPSTDLVCDEPIKINKREVSSENQQMLILKQMTQQVKTKATVKNPKTNSIVSLALDRNIQFVQESKRKSSSLFSKTYNPFQNKPISQQIQKPLTMRRQAFRKARKSLNVDTHKHIISKQFFPVDKCEIVNLPRTAVNMRKDIKKGRVMIEQYLRDKKIERQERQENKQIKKPKSMKDAMSHYSAEKRDFVTQSQKRFKIQDLISSRANSQGKLSERKINSIKGSQNFNRIFDSVFFSGFKNMDIDNMAMMIKTFNK